MDNHKKWYQKWWVWVTIALFLLFFIFGVPLIINVCYMPNSGYITVWDGKDVLQYFGAVLSFLGTIVLGAIAVWQNNRANDLTVLYEKTNQDLLRLQTYEYKPKLFVVSFVGVSKFGVNTLNDNIETNIINAKNIIIKKLVKDPGKTFNGKDVELLLSSTYETEDK